MFYKLPIVLFIIILMVSCFGTFLPLEIKEILYALSLSIKSLYQKLAQKVEELGILLFGFSLTSCMITPPAHPE